MSIIVCVSHWCEVTELWPSRHPTHLCLLLNFTYQISTVVKGQQRTLHEIARTAVTTYRPFRTDEGMPIIRKEKRNARASAFLHASKRFFHAAVSAFGHEYQMAFFPFVCRSNLTSVIWWKWEGGKEVGQTTAQKMGLTNIGLLIWCASLRITAVVTRYSLLKVYVVEGRALGWHIKSIL